MQENHMSQQTQRYSARRRRRRVWQKIAVCLSCVVVFITTYLLILPAITMEQTAYCGIEAHAHDESCFEKRLICGFDEETAATEETVPAHVHGEECYAQEQELICGMEESSGHIHDESCVQREQVLICTGGMEGHEHSDACYRTEETYICGWNENDGGHTHGSACYELRQVLICGHTETEESYASEAEAHVHTEECYETVLICGKEEHTHELICYSDPTADVESEAVWKRSFSEVTFTGVRAKDVLAIARSQLGYQESARNYTVTEYGTIKGYTRYGAWYGDPYGDWCAMFASFCLHYAEIDNMPLEANCQTWIEVLKEADLYAEASDYTPKPGDLIFFNNDDDGDAEHVGIVEEITETELKTIEGNSGNAVAQNHYDRADGTLLGYGLLPAEEMQRVTKTAVIYTDGSYETLAEDAAVITLNGRFPEDAEVRAFPVPIASEKEVLCAYNIAMFLPDSTLFELQKDERITVSIRSSDLNTEMSDGNPEKAVYCVAENGDTEQINFEMAGDLIRFETDRLAAYMVLAVRPTTVGTPNELQAAIEAGKEYIRLSSDIVIHVNGDDDNGDAAGTLHIPAGVRITIDLNGQRLLQHGTGALFSAAERAALTMIDSKHSETHVHTEECLAVMQLLTCEAAAPEHTHTEACYAYEEIYLCGQPKTPDETVFSKTAATEDCIVTVTYGPEAEIPENAELSVSAYLPGTEEYDAQYSRFLTTYAEWTEAKDVASVNFLHFYRVEFSVDGTKIEPKSAVSMQFEFTGAELPRECAVISCTDAQTEILTEPDVWIQTLADDGEAICFSLKQFSDIAIFGNEVNSSIAEPNRGATALAEGGNTSVTVTMVWEDGNAAHAGESVMLTLYCDDVNTGKTLELNEGNNWTGTFADLPDGATYTVRETVPTGWYTESLREESTTGGTAWIPATRFEAGGIYTFVYNTNSTPMAGSSGTSLTEGSVTKGTETITLNGQTYDDYLTEVPENAQWTAQSTGTSSTLASVGRSGNYLRRSSTSFLIGTNTSNRTVALNARSSGGFRVSNTTATGTTYYWQAPGTATTTSSSATRFYLYRQISTPTVTEITYTVTNKKLAGGGSGGSEDSPEYMLYHDKVIDAFRDDRDNPDTDLDNTASDLSDLYRLYLNAGLKVDMTPVDLLIVVDRSGSMDQVDVPMNDDTLARDSAVTMVLNGSLTQATSDGLIGRFLDMNPENQIAVTSFYGTQNISTTASAGYNYTKDSAVLRSWTSVNTFVDAANVYNNGTNYEAGLLSADALFAQVANDGHKKVMVFISDGVPTFYIDDSGNRQGTGVYSNQANVDNCRGPSKAAYDVFKANNPDVITYTIGVSKDINGTSLETSISPDVLKYMSGEDHFFGVTTFDDLYDALELIITNDIGFFHPLIINDALSAEVELADDPDFKATMKRADGSVIVLYENGQITAAGGGVVQRLSYDDTTRSVTVVFTPNYRMEFNSIFEVSFNVNTTEQAYKEYADNLTNGLDGYGGVKGDADTDYSGNTTSSGKPGFHSNNAADLIFEWRGSEYDIPYDHPVVQVASCDLIISKVSMSDDVGLAGAEFDLYRKAVAGENGVSLYTLEGKVYDEADSFVQVNSASIVTNEDGKASVTDIPPGIYYLVETKAPDGYNALDEPRKITLTRTTVTTPTGDSMLEGSSVEIGIAPTLTVRNSDGYTLPKTGGTGTTLYTMGGILLVVSAALLLLYIRIKRGKGENATP